MPDTFGKEDCIHVNEIDASCKINQGLGNGNAYCRVIWENLRCYCRTKPEEVSSCPRN